VFPGSKSFGCYSFKVAQRKKNRVRNVDLLVKVCVSFVLSLIPFLALSFPLRCFTLLLSHSLTLSAHVHVRMYAYAFFSHQKAQASINYCIVLSHSSSLIPSPRQFGANWIISEQLLSPQEQEKVQKIKIKISQPFSTAN